MKKIATPVLILVLLFFACTGIVSGQSGMSSASADILFYNGSVYTVVPGTSWESQPEEALAIAGDRILWVGNTSETRAYAGPDTRFVDLNGRMVLPGFFDTHVHYGVAAVMSAGVNLRSGTSIADYQQLVRHYAESHPNLSVIRGIGWTYDVFPATGPDRALLDAVVPDRPVVLNSYDGHSIWVNSKALEMAGITKSTRDPEGGKIERDAEGNPSGTFREQSAMLLLSSQLPDLPAEEIEVALKENVEMASSHGVTTAHDAAVYPPIDEAYEALEDRGELPVRMYGEIVAIPVSMMRVIIEGPRDGTENPAGSVSLADVPGFQDDSFLTDLNPLADNPLIWENSPVDRHAALRRFNLRTAKIYIDGVVEGHTAVLLSQYNDTPGFYGTPVWTQGELNRKVASLDRQGYQIDVHAIGDGAVRMALDAYSYARATNGVRDSRFKISHIEFLSDKDIPRFRQMGIIADFQPNWFFHDPKVYNITVAFAGKDRAEQMFPIKKLDDAGATVAFGSDWPVGTSDLTMNPLDGIQTAVTHLPFNDPGSTADVYAPDQRISLKAAIEDTTIHGAYASFLENETGSLEPGKYADLVILDRDIFYIPPQEINQAVVVSTWLQGKEVYRNRSFDTGATGYSPAASPEKTTAPLSPVLVLSALAVAGILVLLMRKIA